MIGCFEDGLDLRPEGTCFNSGITIHCGALATVLKVGYSYEVR